MKIVNLGLVAILASIGFYKVDAGHAQAQGNHEHQNQGYFQYANVPAYGQYEFGYNRGNPHHYTSRYEQGNNWRFRTKVRWGDKYGGYGEHYWDYNHVDKGHKGLKGHGSNNGHQLGGHNNYGHIHQHQPSYENNIHDGPHGSYSQNKISVANSLSRNSVETIAKNYKPNNY